MASRLLSLHDRPHPDASLQPVCFDPQSSQFQMWLAQARRDSGLISDKEMRVVEKVAGPLAKKSIAIFNPFTGEKRRIEV